MDTIKPKNILQVEAFNAFYSFLKRNNDVFQMYYDETNNVRRLTLTELGLNAPDNKTFVLAGIVLEPGQSISSIDDLRAAIRLQSNAPELKGKHVAEGDYPSMLASAKLEILLRWLIDHNLSIHYSALDVVYWSLIDLMDSLLANSSLMVYHLDLKSELYRLVKLDQKSFMTLLHTYAYPDIKQDKVEEFVRAIEGFVNLHIPRHRNPVTSLLCDLLHKAIPKSGLLFLEDNVAGELIGDFSAHFLRCVYTFKNAIHTFDQETYIEKVLKDTEVRDGNRKLDYRFVDSRSEVCIQLSDVIAGLIGKHFTYLQEHSIQELEAEKKLFSPQQLTNLELLRTLIDRSDEVSDGFCHFIGSLDTTHKNNWFLHNVRTP